MFKEKHQFYVQFLGWVECRGLRGRQFTDPVIHDLRRKYNKLKNAPKLTIQVSKKELKISKDEEKKKTKIKTIKFPPIPTRDVTYVTQSYSPRDGRPEDIVACIYLGLVPRTKRYVHVHVYRFDSPDTASKFVRFLDNIVAANVDRIRDIEQQLAASGDIDDAPRNKLNPHLNSSDGMSEPYTGDSALSTYSGETFPSNSDSDEIEPDMQSLRDVLSFDSITDELKYKLQVTTEDGPPILLPPRDYDTVCRRHGNLDNIEKRKCLQLNIVGGGGLSSRPRNGSGESGIDVSSPSQSENKVLGLDSPSDSSPSSPLAGARDFAFSRQSSRSPKLSERDRDIDRHEPFRNPSFSSAYSSHSCKSDMSSQSNGFPEGHIVDDAVIYRGVKNIPDTVIPPADYDPNETVAIRQNNHRWKGNKLSQSAGGERFERALKTSLEKRRVYVEEPNGPQYADVYDPRGQELRVRRVNSMYR